MRFNKGTSFKDYKKKNIMENDRNLSFKRQLGFYILGVLGGLFLVYLFGEYFPWAL